MICQVAKRPLQYSLMSVWYDMKLAERLWLFGALKIHDETCEFLDAEASL